MRILLRGGLVPLAQSTLLCPYCMNCLTVCLQPSTEIPPNKSGGKKMETEKKRARVLGARLAEQTASSKVEFC